MRMHPSIDHSTHRTLVVHGPLLRRLVVLVVMKLLLLPGQFGRRPPDFVDDPRPRTARHHVRTERQDRHLDGRGGIPRIGLIQQRERRQGRRRRVLRLLRLLLGRGVHDGHDAAPARWHRVGRRQPVRRVQHRI